MVARAGVLGMLRVTRNGPLPVLPLYPALTIVAYGVYVPGSVGYCIVILAVVLELAMNVPLNPLLASPEIV